MQLTLDHVTDENYNVRTFWYKPEAPLSYTAGQFIELYLPHDNPDNRGIKRWFTLSSSPTEKLVSHTTKLATHHPSSFKKALWSLNPGSKVKIVEPMGDFVLPKDKSIPLVFVAGGIGVTPFRSMVKWLADTKEKRQIQIVLAANASQDFLFEELFSSYGAEVHKIVSQPTENWRGAVGQLSASKIIELTGNTNHKQIYVSGPEPMVENLETELLTLGIDRQHLVFDFFPGYTPDLK